MLTRFFCNIKSTQWELGGTCRSGSLEYFLHSSLCAHPLGDRPLASRFGTCRLAELLPLDSVAQKGRTFSPCFPITPGCQERMQDLEPELGSVTRISGMFYYLCLRAGQLKSSRAETRFQNARTGNSAICESLNIAQSEQFGILGYKDEAKQLGRGCQEAVRRVLVRQG